MMTNISWHYPYGHLPADPDPQIHPQKGSTARYNTNPWKLKSLKSPNTADSFDIVGTKNI